MRLIFLALACMCLCLPVSAANMSGVLAQGDQYTITTGYEEARVWVFSETGLDHLYDINTTRFIDNTGYLDLTPQQTESFDPGKYNVVIHYIGPNNIREVRYAERYNASLMRNEYLVSPFKDVPDIDINGWQPNMVLSKLHSIIRGGTDDHLEFINITVEKPSTVIRGIDQLDDFKVELFGTSNLRNGTPLTIVWDSDKVVSLQDRRMNTFSATVYENNESERIWNTTINVSVQDLSPGKHWVDLIARGLTTRVVFNAGEYWSNQTPPPAQKIRYMNDGVVVTPTPEIIEKPVYVDRTVIQTVITIITTQPFPHNALGEEYNPSTVPDVSPVIIPAVAGLLAIVVLKKGAGNWRPVPQRKKVPVEKPSIVPSLLQEKKERVPLKNRVSAFFTARTAWMRPAKKVPSLPVPEPKPESEPAKEIDMEELFEETHTEGDEYFGQL